MKTEEIADVWQLLWQLNTRLCECARSNEARPDEDVRLSVAQIRVLDVLYSRQPETVRMKDIAESLHLTPGAVTQTVDLLVRIGIVERHQLPDDRRAIAVSLSETGCALLNRASHRIWAALAMGLEGSSEEDQAAFHRILRHLWSRLSQ